MQGSTESLVAVVFIHKQKKKKQFIISGVGRVFFFFLNDFYVKLPTLASGRNVSKIRNRYSSKTDRRATRFRNISAKHVKTALCGRT